MFGSARQFGLCGQCGCGRFVQSLPLAGQQLVVHGFAHQRVTEPAAVALEHQDLVGDGLAQRLADLAERPPGHGRQQPIVDGAADQRCLTQHALGPTPEGERHGRGSRPGQNPGSAPVPVRTASSSSA